MTTPHTTSTLRTRLMRHTAPLLGATALVFALGSCGGDDDTTEADDDVDDAVDEIEDDVDDAVDEIEDDVDDAVEEIEEGVDDVTGAVSDAIEEVGEDTVELAARNLASTHAGDEFADAGYPIDGGLSCTADATEDLTAVDLECTGATEAGGVASMTGTTTELPGESLTEMEGDFVGSVDNEEVFRTDALG